MMCRARPTTSTTHSNRSNDTPASLRGDGLKRIVTLGGDHTVALPMLRAAKETYGPIALVHFDAHLDTWDTYFNAPITHGTVFRRAFEEGLLAEEKSIHVGIRGPVYDELDLVDDARFGFRVIRAGDLDVIGIDGAVDAVRRRVGDAPVYISVDIDVLDPAFAPGTGTPEIGGSTAASCSTYSDASTASTSSAATSSRSRRLYDHAEITCLAAATVAFDLVTLMSKNEPGGR